MRKRPVALVVGIAALGLLVAGCGGSDDGGGSSATGAESGGTADSPSPEKEAFQSKVNVACSKSNAKARAGIIRAYGTPQIENARTEAEAIQFEVGVLVPILIADAETRAEAIGALEAPDDEEDQVEEIVDAFQAWIDKASNTPLKIVVANDIYNDARKLSGKFPLVKCGLNPFEEP